MHHPGGYPQGPPGGYGTQPPGYPPQPGFPAGQYPPGQPAGQYPPGQPAGQYPPGQPAGQYPPGQPTGQYPPGQPTGQYPPGQPAGQYPPAGAYHGSQPGYPPQGAGATPYSTAVPSYQGAPAGAAPGAQPAGDFVDQPSWQGEMPSSDVADDPNAAESQPSAPPLAKMDTISGYNDVTYSDAFLPPPSYDDATRPAAAPERGPVQNLPVITEEQAREALIQFVSENCCYGKELLQKWCSVISNPALLSIIRWRLLQKDAPLLGLLNLTEILDTPMNGPAPGPWDIQAAAPQKFKDQVSFVEVPHTASVKPCHDCIGNGRVRCHRCMGRGNTRCSSCHGSGRTTHHEDGHHHHRTCTWCHGSGRRRCFTCHGHGQVKCRTCDGCGQLKCYIKLTIKWLNHLTDHIVERTALPDELIRGVSGRMAFEEEYPRVYPINHFPDAAINQVSSQLVSRHSTEFPLERILCQRQRVRIVPVTQASYTWKNKDDSYFVYGFEHKVYAPNYPQQCCCGCTIL